MVGILTARWRGSATWKRARTPGPVGSRRKYLLMVNSFLRRLLDLRLDWVDAVESDLGPSSARHDGPR